MSTCLWCRKDIVDGQKQIWETKDEGYHYTCYGYAREKGVTRK